jgi:hypothetical protein
VALLVLVGLADVEHDAPLGPALVELVDGDLGNLHGSFPS